MRSQLGEMMTHLTFLSLRCFRTSRRPITIRLFMRAFMGSFWYRRSWKRTSSFNRTVTHSSTSLLSIWLQYLMTMFISNYKMWFFVFVNQPHWTHRHQNVTTCEQMCSESWDLLSELSAVDFGSISRVENDIYVLFFIRLPITVFHHLTCSIYFQLVIASHFVLWDQNQMLHLLISLNRDSDLLCCFTHTCADLQDLCRTALLLWYQWQVWAHSRGTGLSPQANVSVSSPPFLSR